MAIVDIVYGNTAIKQSSKLRRKSLTLFLFSSPQLEHRKHRKSCGQNHGFKAGLRVRALRDRNVETYTEN